MPQIEIYFDDLSKSKQKEILNNNKIIFNSNFEYIPIAVIEFEDDEDDEDDHLHE